MKRLFKSRGSSPRITKLGSGCHFDRGIVVEFIGAPVGLVQVVGQSAVQNASVPGNPQAEWPACIATTVGTVTIYQPQLIKLDGDVLHTRAAVSILKTGETDPIFGAIWMESRLATDRTARTAQIMDVNVSRSRFPDDNGLDERQMTVVLRSTLPQQPLVLSLDQLLSMVQAVDVEKQTVRDISNDPPKIVFRNHPSVLLQYDGAPRLVQVEGANILRADNTPFFVALDLSSKSYYLKGGGRWYVARDPMGPFQDARTVPNAVANLADTSGYKDPQEALPDEVATDLEVVTAMEPTELIWTTGPEEMGVIPNTDLLYLTNTQSDVFLSIDTQQIYVLLSGRWYVAPNRNGPWEYVAADALPADFKMIPVNGEKGDVLAHVAGTQAARDAVADTFVPQTATVDRTRYEQPVVEYDGAPVFQQIETTQVSYCVNTPQSVLFVRGRYYLCSNAVWYVSDRPTVRWDLCTLVPGEVYTIPSTCPVYSVRYVYVYDYTPDVVYVGYLPGYVGCYPHRGVVVYGTGYHYRPWIGHTYYARPSTFGFAARYNAYSGHWGFTIGYTATSGYGWIGSYSETRVSTTLWFGQGGYRSGIIHHDPAPRRDDDHRGGNIFREDNRRPEMNVYERRGDVRRPANSNSHDAPRPNPVDNRGDKGRDDGPRNNVFTDSKGDVYRKTIDGWDRLEHNKWVPRDGAFSGGKETPRPVGKDQGGNKPGPKAQNQAQDSAKDSAKDPGKQSSKERDQNYGELNRDYKARVDGDQRSKGETKPTPPSVASPHATPPPPSNDRGGKTDRQPSKPNAEPPVQSPPQPGKDRDTRGDSRGNDNKPGKPSNEAPAAAPPAPAPPAPSAPKGNAPRAKQDPKAPAANPPQQQAPTNDPAPGNDDNHKGDSNDHGDKNDHSDRNDRGGRR